MRNPEEARLADQALDNAYDTSFNTQPVEEYPSLERSKELLQAMLDNPDLTIKLGGTALGGADDYFTKTQPQVNTNQLKLFGD